MSMVGGFKQEEVTAYIQELVNELTSNINTTINAPNSTWAINGVWTQIVAGKNYFLHLTSNNNTKISVCIFRPLPHTQQPPEVALLELGHTQARNPNSWFYIQAYFVPAFLFHQKSVGQFISFQTLKYLFSM